MTHTPHTPGCDKRQAQRKKVKGPNPLSVKRAIANGSNVEGTHSQGSSK